MPAVGQRRFSYAEYLDLEQASTEKNEYLDGQIVAMAGGTGSHSRLKTNLAKLVAVALAGGRCRAYDSDLRVRVEATGLATYPDLSVVCGPRQPHPEDRHAATNPTALFEVLSKDTAGYDRGEKFDHYQRIASLRLYVLVDGTRPHVDVYTRQDDGAWARRGYEPGTRAALPGLDIEIDVTALYDGWEEERLIDEGESATSRQ